MRESGQGWGRCLSLQLETRLDNIYGMSEDDGNHATEAAKDQLGT